MMRIGKHILFWAAFALLSACSITEENPEQKENNLSMHYRVTVSQSDMSKASLDGGHYVFQEGDRLYVSATGEDADNLYGFLHLISGAGSRTAVFDGDLYSPNDFTPSTSTALAVTLVGANDLLHTVTDGKVTAVNYGTSSCTDTFDHAVERYSHFTASGHFGDRSFTLTQQSSFLRCAIKYSSTLTPDDTELSIKILDDDDNELRAAVVEADAVGALSWARFVAVFPGGADLTGAKLTSQQGSADAVEFSPLNSGSSITLAANTYYDLNRSNLPTWGGFKITATQDNTAITFNYAEAGDKVYYSIDDGLTWTAYKTTDGSIPLNAGEELCIKGERPAERNYYKNKLSESGSGESWTINYTTLFSSSGNKLCNISGDMRSLLYGDNFESHSSIPDNAFAGCFCKANWINIESNMAGTLIQAETLGNNCFEDMFHGCTTLTRAPDFPYTTSFGEYCCRGMFRKCSGLITASTFSTQPTTVAKACFQNMFRSCGALTTIPSYLPATVMSQDCYREMFRNCTSITSVAPGMLPSTNLAQSCYRQLFGGCSSLTNAPNLPATNLARDCYGAMFGSCSKLTTAPALMAATLVTECYWEMFSGCGKLNEITCLATDISASKCTTDWVKNIGSSGTRKFKKASSMESWTTGVNGIPSGWTVEDYVAP